MLLADLVAVSEAVSATSARSKKIALLASALRDLDADEVEAGVSYLAGKPLQNRLGAGYATVYGVDATPASAPSLRVIDVDRILGEVAAASGPGSKAAMTGLLGDLFSRATRAEQEFLRGLVLRNLRQGALEGIMADAVAVAVGASPARVRRAAMLEGDLVTVAARALVDGSASLGEAAMQTFVPVQPMLAKTAATAGEAVSLLGVAIVERKLDGLRIQVHRRAGEVRVYTRNLRDITGGVFEIVEAALDFGAEELILDGEGLMLGDRGRPFAFQDSMSRFGSEDAEGRMLRGFFFDCLRIDGLDLIDEPLSVRRDAMASAIPSGALVESIVTGDPGVADLFFEKAVADGFEGVVVKDPSQPYEAGRRGSGWLKVKPTHTLDLVVLAAEWGSGRREGWLSNLHLGARSGSGDFVMLGKTFKGLTDEMLAWQTERFLEIEERRTGHVVYLKPEIVYEIAFDGVQRSSRYPGGVALRFARVKAHRDDKGPEEADTIETVRSFL